MAHVVCISHTLYSLTITSYCNPGSLIKTPISLSISIIFSGLIGSLGMLFSAITILVRNFTKIILVQAYFAYRIQLLSRTWLISSICWVLSFVRLLGSIVATIEAVNMTSLHQYSSQWRWLLTTLLSSGFINDILISGTLVYLLRTQRQNALKP